MIELMTLQLKRGFAQDRQTNHLDTNFGCADDQLVDEKPTALGHQEITGSEGETPTPRLQKATTTKDFFTTSREERLRRLQALVHTPYSLV
jgi:hypothetical protein